MQAMHPARDQARSAAGAPGGGPARPGPADPKTVLEPAEIGRALTRIAHEILERTDGAADVMLLGIPTRGVPLARRLAERIEQVEGHPVPHGSLDITMYRDDLRLRPARALGRTEVPPEGIDGAIVVIVDDVLYSGRTVRAALDALNDLGRPRAVQLAVLIDRGHRELPVRPDYVGKNLPTSKQEVVRVLLTEVDGQDAVIIGPHWEQHVNRHLISAADLSRDDALLILDTADELARMADRPIKKLPTLRGRTVVNLFFEDSTRTRISFEAAAKRLSADVINFSAKGSSVAKGESLKDTALTLEAMGADAVVIRHSASGAPHRLAGWVRGTRGQRRGRLARAPHPGAAGRVHHPAQVRPPARGSPGRAARHDRGRRAAQPGRPVQRAAAALPWAPRSPSSPRPRCSRSRSARGPAPSATTSTPSSPRADVVMMLRVQQERMNAAYFPSVREYSRRYGLDGTRMAQLPEHAIVMHPGPMNRGVEIAADVADSARSTIVEQVANGVSVRMAVLYLLLGGAEADA